MKLEGKIALVTGASRGIGRACALEYAKAGAHVVAVARTAGGLEELDDEIGEFGGKCLLVPLDLTDGPGVDRLAPALAERFGRLDVLLHCAAALGAQTPVSHMSEQDWTSVLSLNLTATWRLLRGLDPLLRSSEQGRVLVATCEAARTAPAYLAPYAVSKAGLEALVRSYAAETGQASIAVNMFDPGPTRTHLRARYLPGEDQTTLPTPASFAEDFVALTEASGAHSGAIWHHPSREWRSSAGR